MKDWFNNLTILQRKIISSIIILIGFFFFAWGIIELQIILIILGISISTIGFVILIKVEKIEKEEKEKREREKERDRLNKKKKSEQLLQEKLRKEEEKKKELQSIKVAYVIPDGKIISQMRTITTKVRGIYYQDVYEYDISLDDKVFIRHKPTEEYPESAEICLLSNGTLLGYLKQEIANEFIMKFGKNYCFIGDIVEYETSEEDDEEDKIDKIIIFLIFQPLKKHNFLSLVFFDKYKI